MRNRAKCKLCESIIESFHVHDYVSCKCDEIAVDGGNDYCRAAAKNWENFIRLDDDGNEVQVKVYQKEEEEIKPLETKPKTKEDLLDMLDNMIASIEKLPSHAMCTAVTNYDFCALLILLSSILKKDK